MFPCLLGDSDEDGVDNCSDECRANPCKVIAGACGCNSSDAETDGDHVPDCIESEGCDTNPELTVVGQCGGCSVEFRPAGTKCNDDIGGIATAFDPVECNGAGICGDPQAAAPGPGCFYFQISSSLNSVYWVCPGPVSRAVAQEACRVVPDRRLVSVDGSRENDILTLAIETESFIGANDLGVPEQWRWSTSSNDEGTAFWLGGSDGARVSVVRDVVGTDG
jgi:hypothetical protein